MKTVQNPTTDTLVIPGTPSFAPGEQRKVSDADAATLTNGTPLVIVVSDPPKAKKPTPTS
jgi:hypothetical protein